jgi:hypothetical protein
MRFALILIFSLTFICISSMILIACHSQISDDSLSPSKDYRDQFIGKYNGFRDCSAWNVTQLHPDEYVSIIVKFGHNSDFLNVSGDEVFIDSTGNNVNSSIANYRWYSLSFSMDSLYIGQGWGVTGAQESCFFKGKKK